MNSLICPISSEKVNKSVVRITAFFIATAVALYVLTGNLLFIFAITIDFMIRAFTSAKFSPLSFLAYKTSQLLKLKPQLIGKAPKLFASRIGFLFSIATIALFPISPVASIVVSLILMSFALLEALFDFCMGCVVYTYIVLPLNNVQNYNETNV
jgi:hypothetical protein